MKTLLVFNLNSGKGKIIRDLPKIEDFFKCRNWPLSLFEVKEDLNLVTQIKNMALDFDAMIVAGGDGTIHSVVTGLMYHHKDKRPKLLVLPYGTTNDVSFMLGMSKNVLKALSVLDEKTTRYMDIHQANNDYFLYAAAIGKFSRVSYEINRKALRHFGSIGYFINTLRDFFKPYVMNVKIKTEDKVYEKKSYLIILGAGTRIAGFNLSKFSTKNRLNSGLIGVRVFTRNHIFSWIKMVRFYLFKGRHFKNDLHLDVSKAVFEVDKTYHWNIDGEKGPKGTLTVKVLKEEICVFVNKEQIKHYF